jgi:ATP-dependent Lhr-like helicase
VEAGRSLFVRKMAARPPKLSKRLHPRDHLHYFFHSLIGRSANDALSRIVALRVKNRIGGNALATIDDYGFLLTLRRFQELPLEDLRQCFARGNAENDLANALRGSELIKWQFRGVAQTGLMVPRNFPGRQRKQKQLSWSAEVLFRVLEQHEPEHPLLVESYLQATHTFLEADSAYQFLNDVQTFDWKLLELPAVSPFSFAIYASVIKENMMLEDPASAIERIYREMVCQSGECRGRYESGRIKKEWTLRSTPSHPSSWASP